MSVLSNLRTKLGRDYSLNGPQRVKVPVGKIDWVIEFKDYWPPNYTSLSTKPGTDQGEIAPLPEYKFNCIDGGVNRVTFHGTYLLDPATGCPLNPVGRTGLSGRGVLPKWGPNHAADTIITRPLHEDGRFVTKGKVRKPVFQFIGITRRDTGEWAIPGGKIEAGEDALAAGKREFFEEVFSIEDASKEEKLKLEKSFAKILDGPHDVVYKGYVDDPRATDNSWMETQVIHFHADTVELQNILTSAKFKAGSDARAADWVTVCKNLKLYASHKSFLKTIAEKHGWNW